LNKLISKNKEKIKKILDIAGYDYTNWNRTVLYNSCREIFNELKTENLETLEISAGNYYKDNFKFKSYKEANFPDFDVCKDTLDKEYDLIIADQVFEHLLHPYKAAQNVYSMLKPGGSFFISTPFLIKLHYHPHDCTRWSETGLKYFLNEAGFPFENIEVYSWGNRACVKGNFKRWTKRGWFKSLKNEPEFPVTVWAIARK
jgi:SAM-dependent methyltransferase